MDRMELKMKCAWLVAQDRRAYFRDEGLAGMLPSMLEAAKEQVLAGFKRLNWILDDSTTKR